MAQQVVIAGALFNNVPAISVPDSNNVYHQFLDTTIATNAASASDIASGKLAYVNGSLVTGTSSGGGSALTLIATKSLGTISTTSTTAADTGQTLQITGFDAYDLLICICHTSPHTNNRHVATVRLINFSALDNVSTKTGTSIATSTQNFKLTSNGTLTQRSNTTAYGVYVNTATINEGTPRKCTLTIYQRYNMLHTGQIDGTYILDVYGVILRDLL